MGRETMITGYNTDIRHGGQVFHVQTEDKGLEKACVESLVYVGGQIVARRRSGYQALIKDGHGTSAIVELLEKQHRAMIGEIRTGKLDDQTAASDGSEEDPFPEASRSEGRADAHTSVTLPTGGASTEVLPEGLPEIQSAAASGPSGSSAPAPVDRVEELEAGSATPTLDQVILDYLNSEAEQEHLVLVMDSPDDPRVGEEAKLHFQAKTSTSGNAVEDAAIAVRLISTTSEPATLGRGSTDGEGQLELTVQIPNLQSGSAALIVTATSDVGTAEIKHLL